MASRPSKFDLRREFQSEPGKRDMASMPSKFSLGRFFDESSDSLTWPGFSNTWISGSQADFDKKNRFPNFGCPLSP